MRRDRRSSLELVRTPLPIPTHFHSHLDTSIHIFLTSLVIYPELEYIPVLIVSLLTRLHGSAYVYRRKSGIGIGTRQPNVVQERPRTTGCITYKELAMSVVMMRREMD